MRNRFALAAILACLGFVMGSADAQVNVTTWRYNNGRTGQNLNETILNPSDVNTSQFGLLFSQAVDGYVYAEPLYLANVSIGGKTHNVVFVATENDSVYAFDADNNGGANASPLWFASMLSTAHGAAAGATTVSSNVVGTDIIPQVGITGTPVIDPSTGTLYVVSATAESGGYVQRLHALDVTTGAEKFGGPVAITATITGTGNGSSGGSLTFDNLWQNQRPGLLLLNGIVYIAFASHGDNGPWHGWVFGYNAATLKQTGVYCSSPNGVGSGTWMGGAGLAAEVVDPVNHPYGRMFIATGNGDYTATKPYTGTMDYGDSVLNLDLSNGVPTIKDEFTPYNQASMDAFDEDLASGGVMLVPTQTTGSYPNLLVQTGKTGTVYMLNRENLGGYNTAGDQVVQEMNYAVGVNGAWTTAGYWNNTVYYWGVNDKLKAFPIVNGQLTGPTATSSETYGYPGANPVISANGSTQGIVWSLQTDGYQTSGAAILQAHDASNPATTLYSSSTNSTRDNPGVAVKFAVPTVANGKVYVGTQTKISVFGLLNGAQLAATPVLTPGTESFSGTVSVSITDSTAAATIYYTTNGTTPTTSSSVYTGPIAISKTTTVEAIASATGYLQSAVASATYTSNGQASAPTFSLATGSYVPPISVTLSDSTTGATIYYTTDGSTPTTSSTKYTGAFTLSSTTTVNAIAVATGYTTSNVSSATYTLVAGQTGINFPTGFAGTAGIVDLNGSAQLNDSRLQLTSGAVGQAGSAWYYQPVSVQSFTTNFHFQLSNPAGDGITFTIQGNNFYSLGYSGAGLGYQSIPSSVAVKFDLYSNSGEGPDSTGLYTNGASPTLPAIDLSKTGIDLHSDDTIEVTLSYNGTILSMYLYDMVTGASYSTSWTVNIPSIVGGNTAYVGFTGGTGGLVSSQKILSWTYNTGDTAPPLTTSPVFTPAGGAYSTAQSVSISSPSAGATIYYTTNGTTPTTSSTVYSSPLTVSSSKTLEAMAVAPGYAASATNSAAYSIAPVLPAPTFSPAPGTYTSAQSVTISDATSGATIYYSTDGSTPTTGSTLYTGPVTVSASTTLEAIAVETGYNNSPVASGSYVIAAVLPTPTFSPAGGSYATSQSVTISDATPGTILYYTTTGVTPTTSSSVYTGPITVSSNETLEAIAVESGYTTSAVGTTTYTIGSGSTTYISYPKGGFSTQQLSLNNGPTVTGGTLQITDGNPSENRSAWFTTLVPVQSFITDFTFQQTSATGDGMTFAIQGNNIWSLGYSGGGLGYQSIGNSVALKFDLYSNAGEGADSTGLYTNGAAPTVPAIDLSSTGINLHSGDLMSAHIVYDGTNLTLTITDTVTNATVTEVFPVNIPAVVGSNAAYVGFTGGTGGSSATQNVLSWTYASPAGSFAAPPIFSPAGGTYTTAQSVTISDTTPGAKIYYTTNGTAPTTSSSVYSGPITVSASETLEALAAESGYTNSSISTAAYTIAPVLPAPTFSPAAGTYTTAQSVTISDSTAGTTIYYTTNGTTPTTASTKYAGAITVSASETLEAIAVETGYTNSPVATAAYTIAPGTSYISYASGAFTASLLSLNNGPTVTSGVLQLTDGGSAETRSAWFKTPVPVQSFTTDFTFQQSSAKADGMTFTIQNNNIWALGYSGGGLGYQSIPNSVSIKFDLYNNAGEGGDSTGIYTGGAIPTTPYTDLSSTGINLQSGDIMRAHITYNGTNLTLVLTDTVTNATVTQVYPVNIPSLVGANTAYVGFTGGTGGLTAIQNVLAWSYSAP